MARRDNAPVIQRDSPVCVAIRPSIVVASFRVTNGTLWVTRFRNLGVCRRSLGRQHLLGHGNARRPQHRMTPARNPWVRVGQRRHHLRYTPAAINALAQGGARP